MGEEHLSSLAFRHRRAARARLVGLAVFFASIPGVAAAAQFERTLPLRSVVLPSVNAADLAPGWNLGNSLEAYAGGTLPKTSSQETLWGNPPVDQAIMNGIAAAGFKSVRIPVAWGQYTDRNNVVQNGFNQMFVSAVRKTGGNSATRTLVVQTYNTNIDFGMSCNRAMPTDTAFRRLMVEVHYYDPYDFTLNTSSQIWQWGVLATNPANTETWANESYVDNQFQKMKSNFIDRGIPVILGEYAASLRTEYDSAQQYRNYWDQYITMSARRHGLVPFYWDNGSLANHQSGLFVRSTGARGYPTTISLMVNAR